MYFKKLIVGKCSLNIKQPAPQIQATSLLWCDMRSH